MVKYFCDICGKEVQRVDNLDIIKISTDYHSYNDIYYSACVDCRIKLNEYILKIREENKNGNT
jgi:hypothetical protein